MRQHLPYAISKDGKSYGKMYAADSSGNIFTRFGYVCLELPDNTLFSMYTIGLGKDGIVYPIYRGDKLVAEKYKRKEDNCLVFCTKVCHQKRFWVLRIL